MTPGKAGSLIAWILLWSASLASPALAQQCGGDFNPWLAGVRQQAASQGVSEQALAALDGVRLDKSVIKHERAQGVLAQTFLQFSDRMVARYGLSPGASQIKKHAKSFACIEKQYDVQGPVITAFLGLKTDFGTNQGEFSTLNVLATLAHDYRRPQSIDALKLIDRADLPASRMVGALAGELGQT